MQFFIISYVQSLACLSRILGSILSSAVSKLMKAWWYNLESALEYNITVGWFHRRIQDNNKIIPLHFHTSDKTYLCGYEKRGPFGEDGSMKQNIITVSNLLSTKFNVVVILVSVYNHKHRVWLLYSTLHGTYNMLHTTNTKSHSGSFFHSRSHLCRSYPKLHSWHNYLLLAAARSYNYVLLPLPPIKIPSLAV